MGLVGSPSVALHLGSALVDGNQVSELPPTYRIRYTNARWKAHTSTLTF